MRARIHDFIDRIASVRSFVLLSVLAVGLVLMVNFADFSWTLPGFRQLTHGVGILDMETHYDANGAYRVLAAQGEAGRAHYLKSLWTLDIAIPVLVSLWLSAGIALAQRHGATAPRAWLTLLPVAAGLSDLLENTGISILLVRYPERLDMLAGLTGDVTTVKHVLYTASLLVAAALGMRAWRRHLRNRYNLGGL
jgi:hypothetical protein